MKVLLSAEADQKFPVIDDCVLFELVFVAIDSKIKLKPFYIDSNIICLLMYGSIINIAFYEHYKLFEATQLSVICASKIVYELPFRLIVKDMSSSCR